jgi:hypothetical protein
VTTGIDEVVDLGNFQTGEVPDPLLYEYLKNDGTPLDISGGTVMFFIKPCLEGIAVAPGTGTSAIVVAPVGRVTYTWASTDMSTAAKYYGQFKVTKGGNIYISHKILWVVFTSLEDQG